MCHQGGDELSRLHRENCIMEIKKLHFRNISLRPRQSRRQNGIIISFGDETRRNATSMWPQAYSVSF